jgi:hypothetical protein
MDKILMDKILINKKESNDKIHSNTITPNLDDFNNISTIYEARGYGESIKVFGDTKDKIVITPKHAGYDYNYVMKDGDSWGSDFVGYDNIDMINEHMFNIGIELSETYKVWMVGDSITCKGYSSSYAVDLSEYTTYSYDEFLEESEEYIKHTFDVNFAILFVFGLDINLIDER